MWRKARVSWSRETRASLQLPLSPRPKSWLWNRKRSVLYTGVPSRKSVIFLLFPVYVHNDLYFNFSSVELFRYWWGGSIFKDCIVLKAKGCNLLDSIRFTELRLCFIIKCEYLSKTWKYLCRFWWSVGQSCNQVEYSDCPARGGTATVNGAERERVDSPTKGG